MRNFILQSYKKQKDIAKYEVYSQFSNKSIQT